MNKEIILSGMQPTGKLHIGNYLGALKNFVDLQESEKYNCFFIVVDLHSLTTVTNSNELTHYSLDLMASYLAVGLDPKKSTLFIQSHVPAHSELAWILNTVTPMGELSRMTQFKEKSETGNVNAGLFTYPVLQTADILLYDADIIPVGEDQLQHLELARFISKKFNSRYTEIFTSPKPLITSVPRLMSLDDPSKKMSKSRSAGCLFLDDTPEMVRSKIMKSVTDSGREVIYDQKNKPGIANLMRIISYLSNKSFKEIEAQFKNATYSDFKKYTAEVVINHFTPIRERKEKLLKNPSKIIKIFTEGSQKANKVALKKIQKVKEVVGLI